MGKILKGTKADKVAKKPCKSEGKSRICEHSSKTVEPDGVITVFVNGVVVCVDVTGMSVGEYYKSSISEKLAESACLPVCEIAVGGKTDDF